MKIHDFTIDQVIFNRYDDKKAVAVISSAFLLYGHETLNLEMIKEDKEWPVVLSRKTSVGTLPSLLGAGKKDGVITDFFKKSF